MGQLRTDMDSVDGTIKTEFISVYSSTKSMFTYYGLKDQIVWPEKIRLHKVKRDSLAITRNVPDPAVPNAKPILPEENETAPIPIDRSYSPRNKQKSDSIFQAPYTESELANALSRVRTVKAQLLTSNSNIAAHENDKRIFYIQWHKIMAQAIACIAMFLIGAPLGAIIKKGGLGVPVLMSILFFILFYVLSLMGEKWAKQSVLSVEIGMWLANATLFIIGFMFLRQARADARLFDSDFYSVIWDRLTRRFSKKTG